MDQAIPICRQILFFDYEDESGKKIELVRKKALLSRQPLIKSPQSHSHWTEQHMPIMSLDLGPLVLGHHRDPYNLSNSLSSYYSCEECYS